MTFSTSTLELFRELLTNVQVPASAPNFEEVAAVVVKAKRELDEAQAESRSAVSS